MGNIEERTGVTHKKVSTVIEDSPKGSNKENTLIPQQNVQQAQPMPKASFHKISPIIIGTIGQPEGLQEMTEVKQKDSSHQERPKLSKLNKKVQSRQSFLDKIMECSKQLKSKQRIEVNWSAFAKIKKKNYLEQYIYSKQIGKGSFGVVVKAKMKYGQRHRAVKIIKESAQLSKNSNKLKLAAEITIPMELDHPNIAKIYEVFEWKNALGIVIELCEGGDLFTYIKNQKKFSEAATASIFQQLISGVNYMHKQGVFHRDIKPENLLYDNQSGLLKIIDFGTATKIRDGKPYTSLMGTPFYIAPEVIQGSYDERCDIWSCGVILYIMLSGAPPFQGRNQKQIFEKALNFPLAFTSPIWGKRSSEVKELIKGMLNKNPNERYTIEQVLSSSWFDKCLKSSDNVEIGEQLISNLKNFHFQNKLKAVVYTFIASQLYENKDKEILLKAFRQIDKDGDGVIQRKQLMEIFQDSKTSLTEEEVEHILKIIDTNGSGRIDFTEFLVAASNEEELLKKKQLENAFAYLDTDHSGFITIEEVKAFLDGSEETGAQIKKIFDEVDQNGDGQISKNEFIALLLSKKEQS